MQNRLYLYILLRAGFSLDSFLRKLGGPMGLKLAVQNAIFLMKHIKNVKSV